MVQVGRASEVLLLLQAMREGAVSDEIGFKTYEWKDEKGNVNKLLVASGMCCKPEDVKAYWIDTDSMIFTPRIDTPLPWHKKMWERLKGAWSLLLRGDDYHE